MLIITASKGVYYFQKGTQSVGHAAGAAGVEGCGVK